MFFVNTNGSKRLFYRLLLLFLLFFPINIYSQVQYADNLVKKANELCLYSDSYWLLLCHYKKTLTGYKSLVDGKDFFLAEKGKTNPKAELEATIRAFFIPKENEKEHPTYAFSARYKWLCEKLDIDKSQLLYDGDADYNRLKETINPKDLYLIFPAAYMNNPASMFGHLFYLIESKNAPHLAGLSVNYGAITTDPPSFIFAMKGLFGAYPAKYDIIPYYQQITKYSYIDMRDTWEYKLLLNDDETDYFLRHVIEMTFTYSRYYYLSENCAYCILFPLEIARPDTKLTDSFGTIVEPIQVILKLQKENLLDAAQYRPSLYSKMEAEKSFLTKKQKRFAKKLCFGKTEISELNTENMSNEEQANLWEFSSDYLKYLLTNNKISLKDYQKRFLAVLGERNKLKDTPSVSKNIPIPNEQPQKAHGSELFSLGGGIKDKTPYGEINFRLLAHNITDTDSGYTPNSQLEFFSGSVRYSFNEDFDKKEIKENLKDNLYLRYFDIANIISLPTSDSLSLKKCFQFRAGFAQNLAKDSDDEINETLAGHIKYALGLSTLITPYNQIYALLGTDIFISPEYNYWTDALAGGELGLLTTIGIWKQNIFATLYQAPFDKEHSRFDISVQERISLHQNVTLKAFYTFAGDFKTNWHEAGGFLNIYF